jgi:hypothetical protein
VIFFISGLKMGLSHDNKFLNTQMLYVKEVHGSLHDIGYVVALDGKDGRILWFTKVGSAGTLGGRWTCPEPR